MRSTIIVLLLTAFLFAIPSVESKSCPGGPKTKKTHGGVYGITITKSGGIAGINETFTLDSNKLAKPLKGDLQSLVSNTGILDVGSVTKTQPNAADLFFYEFKVDYKGKLHSATYDDMTLPEQYRTLLGFVTKHGLGTKQRF
mgnify:CR=1 FL=1